MGETEVGYYVRERFYGAFRRSMTMPEITVQGGTAIAELEHIPIDDEHGRAPWRQRRGHLDPAIRLC